MKALADTAYTPKRRTLMRHMAAIKDGNAPLSAEKGSGRPSTLTPELWAIVFGWVLCQQKPVNLMTVQRWIKANFDKDVSIGTLSRHKDTMGLSFQLVGRRRDFHATSMLWATLNSSSTSIWPNSSTLTPTALSASIS